MKIKFKKKNLRAVEPGGNNFGKLSTFLLFLFYHIFNFCKLFFCTTTALLESFLTQRTIIGGSYYDHTGEGTRIFS